MQININNNITAQNIVGSIQSSKPKAGKNSKISSVSTTVKAKYAKIIEKASKGGDVDPKLVEEAKKMLASGQLDSPEFARQAAAKLLHLGI